MKKFLLILFLLPMAVIGQNNVYTFNAADGTPMKRYDTTINGWVARVIVKQNHDYSTDSTEGLIDFGGLGEVGTDTAKLSINGYGYWISNARWDGTVTLPSGNHHPIIIVVQAAAAWQGASVVETRINSILGRWRIKRRAVHLSGLSMGGWMSTTQVMSDAGSPYARAFRITSVVESGGVIPNNLSPYPDLFDQFADYGARGNGGNLLSFQQDLDGRDALNRVNRMNTNHAGSYYIQTNFGSRGHSNFNDHYNPNTTNWTTSNAEVTTTTPAGGISMSMAQWQLLQGDTTTTGSGGGGGATITANAGVDYAVAYDQGGLARTFNLSGSQTGATTPTYSWVALFGNPSASTITSPASASTTVSGATAPGYYGYELTVTEGGVSDKDTVYIQIRDLMQRGLLPCRSGPGVRHYVGGTLIAGKVTTTEIYIPYITRDNVFPGLMGGDTIVVLKNPNNDTGYWKWVFMGDFSGQRGCRITVVPDTSGSTVVSSGPGGSRGWYLGNGDSATIAFVKFDGGAWYEKTGIRHGFAADNGQYPYDSSDATVYTLNTGAVLNLGHDVEFTGWRFRNSNYMFQVKKNSDSTNQFATYDNYRFRNIYIHHNYGYMLGSEGMYLGHTAWDGIGQSGNNGRTIMMDSLRVEKNVIKKAGKDGIQIANQKTPALIFDNTVDQSGYRNASSHRWSVFIGGNATGSIYRNTIVNARGAAGTLGMGTVYFYDNFIDSVGEGGNTEPAIYVNKSVWTGNFDSLKFRMYNNLILRVLKTGNNSFVQVDNLAGLMGKGKIYNNTFVHPTKTLISQMVVTNASDTVENNTILSSLDISTHPLAAMDSYRVYQLVRSLPDGTPVSFYDLVTRRNYSGRKHYHKGRKFNFKY